MWSVECRTNHDIDIANTFLENVGKLRYMGIKITNKNSIN